MMEKKAKLKFGANNFEVIEPGDYVLCSITKQKIPLENLKYWNVDLQEIYFGPEVALKRYKEINEI